MKIPTIPCSNGHDNPRPAVARLSWPCGRYRSAVLACEEDVTAAQQEALAEGYTLLVEPIHYEERAQRPLDYTPAIREVRRLTLAAYDEPVPAILLEAPDHPCFDELPETIEKRRALPARFHTPYWMGDCKPPGWICNVCWEEGVTYGWPCEVAMKHGGEVFAR